MLREKFEKDDLKGLLECSQSLRSSKPKEVVKQWGRTYFIGEEQIAPYLEELVNFVKKAKKGIPLEEILD
ncbi:hypothetical protein FACS1894176_05840 [Bacteroidia bacterium]|nr:hypothetical protein FACS189428_2630 [Clostridia bacterium]GHV25995.1 hypothetical protein FACS1894176_05840 [Bacteroidia bacterium]